jgi:hypothetical protein
VGSGGEYFRLGGCGATGEQEVRRALCLGTGDDDRPLVVAQDLEPVADVAGVLQLAVDPTVRAEKRRAEFGMSSSAYASASIS